jgi:hypothetical protein
MSTETFAISPRFCGPPNSGHGGYVCGRVSGHVLGVAAVRLKSPPPLEVELRLEKFEGIVQLLRGTTVIAEGRPTQLDLTPPPSRSFQEAQDASKSYLGFTRHPFPRCFACGPQRNVGDGLRIFPGVMESQSMVAAPWLPDASLADDSHSVRAEFIWAALDCTSGLAVLPVPEGQAIVLGELSARIDGRVVAGEKYIAVGWPLSIDGRKRLAGSAIFSESGLPLAIGRALWIEVPESAFLPTRVPGR